MPSQHGTAGCPESRWAPGPSGDAAGSPSPKTQWLKQGPSEGERGPGLAQTCPTYANAVTDEQGFYISLWL